MPCNSDYMEADGFERSLSVVACLLDELDGKKWTRESWNGYHPKVYFRHLDKKTADEMVARLCGELRKRDVTQYSLEMQIWWRDHQEADKRRGEDEIDHNQADD